MSRYVLIAKTFLQVSNQFAGAKIGPVFILAIYLACLGIHVEKRDRMTVTAGVAVLLTMAAGFFVVFLSSPFEIVWHMETSLNRLFLQLWPAAVFLYFLIASPIEISFPREGFSRIRTIRR